MLHKLWRVLLVSRPISWVNTAYPFAAGYIVTGGSNIPLLVIATLYFLIPYNVLMYGINDVFDYESDIKNPRKGGIEGMREQRALHPFIIKTALLMNLPFVVWLLLSGSMLSALILLALLFFVVAYSVKGLRFKEIPVLDSITSSIHFVGPLIYALSFTSYNELSLLVIASFFLWGMASHALGAIQDIIPDRQGGLSSIATALGARVTLILVIGLYGASAALLLRLPFPALLLSIPIFLYALNCYEIVSITDKTSGEANKPWRRFIWLNLFVGFIITMFLIFSVL